MKSSSSRSAHQRRRIGTEISSRLRDCEQASLVVACFSSGCYDFPYLHGQHVDRVWAATENPAGASQHLSTGFAWLQGSFNFRIISRDRASSSGLDDFVLVLDAVERFFACFRRRFIECFHSLANAEVSIFARNQANAIDARYAARLKERTDSSHKSTMPSPPREPKTNANTSKHCALMAVESCLTHPLPFVLSLDARNLAYPHHASALGRRGSGDICNANARRTSFQRQKRLLEAGFRM